MASTSVISAGQIIDGAVSAQEDLIVDGRIDGSVESTQQVVITADGVVEASIHAREVVVEGTVVGDLTVSEDVTVTASGQVQGAIRAKRLTLEAGGRVSGMVVTGVEPVSAAPRPRGHSTRARAKTATWSPSELVAAPEADEQEVEPPVVVTAGKTKSARKKTTARRGQGRSRSGRKRTAKEVVELDEVVETSND